MIGSLFLLVLFWTADSQGSESDPAAEQLVIFKETHPNPIGTISKLSGEPVDVEEMDSLNKDLIFNGFFMDTMTHFSRERIPERVVHGNGAGAFGYFEVTNDVTNICKAKFLSKVGKKTPIAVRFSAAAGQIGTSDLTRDIRGFAVKFYTEEGNFDIPAFNMPVFPIKDPLYFPSFVHSLHKNPQTYLLDSNSLWDVVTLRQETLLLAMYLFSDFGIPYGYAYMKGFGIHTYQLYNDDGESYFVRFYFLPDWGFKTMTSEEAALLAGTEPYLLTKKLYNDIENGNYPSWQVMIQVLTFDDVNNADIDVFDVTLELSFDKYPLTPLGKFTLNRNQKNHFAEIEQLAFCPANMVPGILGAPDKIFEARRLSYRDAQNYRLGPNFNNIPVNCPFAANYNNYTEGILGYYRDGRPPVKNIGNAPNYFPNSFNGPINYVDKNKPDLIKIYQNKDTSFVQPRQFYLSMSDGEKTRLISNIVTNLSQAAKFLQERTVNIFCEIHPELGEKIKLGLQAQTN